MSSRPASSVSTFPSVRHQYQVTPSVTSRDEGSQPEFNEKSSADVQVSTGAATTTAAAPQRRWWSWRLQPRPVTATDTNSSDTPSDPEKGGKRTERKLVMIGPIYAGCGAAMAACEYKSHSLVFLSSSLPPPLIFSPFQFLLEHPSHDSHTRLSFL